MMLNRSKGFKSEYCATIVRIGKIIPIEGTDNLATTEIEGRILVVNKHQIQEGDLRVYFSNECEICERILHELSMYDDKTLNKDPETKGYVSRTGRVRMIKLKGQISMGLTIPAEALEKVYSDLTGFDWASHIREDFDSIGDEVIVKAYVPKNMRGFHSGSGKRKKQSRLVIDIIPESFKLHYDTEQLQRCMTEFKPSDSVTISPKIHGTSLVIGNLKCKVPKWKGLYTRYFNLLPKFLKKFKDEHRVIYSSRQVIKNGRLNDGNPPDDIWHKAYLRLKDFIPKDEILYCEIVGYDGMTMIQKGYDYGCKPGEFKILIYRAHMDSDCHPCFGEMNADELDKHVRILFFYKSDGFAKWDKKAKSMKGPDVNEEKDAKLMAEFNELARNFKTPEWIQPMNIIYDGALGDLYPNIPYPVSETLMTDPSAERVPEDSEYDEWRYDVLNVMKNDKERFGMELDEPLCKNKVPREGIVIRKNDGSMKAWKLKSLKFLGKEAEAVDKGEVNFE